MYTFRELIRIYGDNLENGHTDTDLTPRQRRLTVLALNTASNGPTDMNYPPTSTERLNVIRRLNNVMWEGNVGFFVEIANRAARADLTVAHERAIEILNNI